MIDPLFGCYIKILRLCQKKIGEHTKNLKELRMKQALTSELFQSAKARELAGKIAKEEEQINYRLELFNDVYELLNAMED